MSGFQDTMRDAIVGVLREHDEVKNIGQLADALMAVIPPASSSHAQPKRAFLDGLAYAAKCEVADPEEAWRTSSARARLTEEAPSSSHVRVDPLLATRFKLSFNRAGNCTVFRKDQAQALDGQWVWLIDATDGGNNPLYALANAEGAC